MLVVCPHCQTNIKIQVDLSLKLDGHDEPVTEIAPPAIPLERKLLDTRHVAIAINGEGTREIIKELLEDAGFLVEEASSLDGFSSMLRGFSPATVLVDLSLPGAVNAQLGEMTEKILSPEKPILILVSPGYGKSNLSAETQMQISGAHDYIERGSIQRDLVHKIQMHLNGTGFFETSFSADHVDHVASAQVEPISILPLMDAGFHEEKPPVKNVPSPAVVQSDAPLFASEEARQKAVASARRLARIIVSDIVLYNEKKVEEGVLNDTFYDLLKEEIEEGRRHYNSRVSLDIQQEKDYLNDVFEDFLKKKKAALV
mgnify:CR=1 FL=1